MKVGILMGSPNDRDKMKAAADTLEQFGLEADVRVLSAHRNPHQVVELASTAREEGYVAFICGAGMAAHLAGVVAAHTTLPVVGVPLSGGALNGVDALYATVQMPKGIPVATVAIDGSLNAALLVVEMLAITDADLAEKLAQDRAERCRPIADQKGTPRRCRRGARPARPAGSPARGQGAARSRRSRRRATPRPGSSPGDPSCGPGTTACGDP